MTTQEIDNFITELNAHRNKCVEDVTSQLQQGAMMANAPQSLKNAREKTVNQLNKIDDVALALFELKRAL